MDSWITFCTCADLVSSLPFVPCWYVEEDRGEAASCLLRRSLAREQLVGDLLRFAIRDV